MVSVDSPVSGKYEIIWFSSGTISSLPRHQITVGVGDPLIMHLSSTVSVGLTAFGLIGRTNSGATPVSHCSKIHDNDNNFNTYQKN